MLETEEAKVFNAIAGDAVDKSKLKHLKGGYVGSGASLIVFQAACKMAVDARKHGKSTFSRLLQREVFYYICDRSGVDVCDKPAREPAPDLYGLGPANIKQFVGTLYEETIRRIETNLRNSLSLKSLQLDGETPIETTHRKKIKAALNRVWASYLPCRVEYRADGKWLSGVLKNVTEDRNTPMIVVCGACLQF